MSDLALNPALQYPPRSLAPEDEARAGTYALLAHALRHASGAEILAPLMDLRPADGRDAFALAWEALRLAADRTAPDAVEDEYDALFIGLGRGELVPYGSWYQTGFLMERPLGVLRADLRALGFERQPGVREPEDHVAALFEVMAQLALDTGTDTAAGIERQRAFFADHLGGWVQRFFVDLEAAPSACLYRSVARLGSAFFALERRYLERDD